MVPVHAKATWRLLAFKIHSPVEYFILQRDIYLMLDGFLRLGTVVKVTHVLLETWANVEQIDLYEE